MWSRLVRSVASERRTWERSRVACREGDDGQWWHPCLPRGIKCAGACATCGLARWLEESVAVPDVGPGLLHWVHLQGRWQLGYLGGGMSWFLFVSGRAELDAGIKSMAADCVVTSGFSAARDFKSLLSLRMVPLSPLSITDT